MKIKVLSLLILVLFLGMPVFAAVESTMGGPGTAENYRWEVNSGDIIPADDSVYDIGASGSEVAEIYVDAIILNGTSKSSWGSIVSPWEDDGTTTTLTSAPTKFILTHSTGVSTFTGYIAGTADIVLENGQIIDGGTNNAVKFTDNSDTASITFSGDDVVLDTTDGGYIFTLTDATDGTVDFMTNNDADDYIQISTTTNQPLINFVGCNGSITAASGTISFGDENLTTTGTASLGATTATSFIVGDDTIDVVVDNQLRFASNDEESTIEALGYTGKNAVLQLTCDLGADAGDKIQLVSDQATNSLFFTSDTGVKDTHATILTLAKTGLITTTGDINVVNDSATTNAVQDVLKLTSSSTGTPAAGLGAGVVFHIDDLGGIEEQASIDVAMTDVTDAAEFADVVVSQNTAGAIAETLRLVAASSATVSDYLQFTANTTETNAATNVLVLKTATGTAADNYGMSISFQPEDATGSEEVASLDIIETTAARATNDTDFVFSQNINGTITETFRLNADSNNTMAEGLAIADATDASDLTTASLVTAGGIACAKQLYVGDDIDMSVSGTGVYDITLKTDVADALSITDGTDIMVFATTTGTPTVTITPATTVTGTLTTTGAIVANGAVTLGNAVTDVITVTGKVAGASPFSFDGATANTVYTILAVDDAASTSKTVTLPSVTGTVMLTGAATALTADTTATITVTKGNQLFTYTIDTDDENCTLTFSGGGAAGDRVTIIFITDAAGSGDEIMTFETTLANTTGTLTLANVASGRYVIEFVSDGTVWNEVSRTAVQS